MLGPMCVFADLSDAEDPHGLDMVPWDLLLMSEGGLVNLNSMCGPPNLGFVPEQLHLVAIIYEVHS